LGMENMIRFLGFRKDIYDVLAASDCFVLASRSEGCPFSILEALAMEKPIIASSVPGIAELLQYSQQSRLVPWNDAQALSQALAAYLTAPFAGAPRESLPASFVAVRSQMETLQ